MSPLTRWVLAPSRLVVAGVVVLAIGGFAVAGPAPKAAASTPAPNPVRDVQTRLAALRFLPPSQVDGKPGPRTKHAIAAFQQWSRLTPDGIAGPNTLAKLRTASIPPAGNKGPPRRIEIYRAMGITLLIDRGKVTRAMHSSAGKRGYETPSGTHRIVRKVRRDWSHPYKSWMPYASYFVRGYALHEDTVPTHPASHGCVRLPPADATDAYRFATIGTTVVVY